ncbi:acetate/propionate family kinase [Rhodovastum atsumiense]|uniref:Acetate kinase n=2 Tax=Rhodovastum atsumiense TaxID=504468 RepID=A0A5M6IRZ0_9PROT|nr:acetate/propionate family kinase [Rhodovastum atsumiense]
MVSDGHPRGCIVVLNAGSSSIKFAIHAAEADGVARFRGQVQGIGSRPHLGIRDQAGRTVQEREWPAQGFDHHAATGEILRLLPDLVEGARVLGVGHRVVHGGTEYATPVRVDATVLADLARLVPLAPLHQPHALVPMHAIAEKAATLSQVACFDTAFHRSQPLVVQRYALPRRFHDEGLRRYGFHGLSYEFIVSRLREVAPQSAAGRVVICHLGSGSSLCAVQDGRSVATTMGFTTLEGLAMGTRCGTLDPGVLLYLMDTHGMDARAIEDLLYRQSGLLGVSGISSDLRRLRASSAPEAAEAIALFVHRIVREVASMAAAMGGIDAMVFTGGIGENDAAIRAEVAHGCAWLGLAIDAARNAQGTGRISAAGSRIDAWVLPTDEERMIARHTAALLGLRAPPG